MSKFYFLENIDLLGSTFTFKLNSKDTHKTKVGGCLTILLFLIWIFLFVLFGQNYFYKTNPNGFMELIPNSETDGKLKLDNYHFLMSFTIQNDKGKVIPFDEYFHAMFFVTRTTFIGGEYIKKRTKLKTISCADIDIRENIDKKSFNLNSYICPDFSGKHIELFGNFDDYNSTMIEFFLSVCDENNSNCKSPENIKEFANNGRKWLSIISPKVSYNINDFNEPLKTILHKEDHLFTPHKYSYHKYDYSKHESNTDVGDIISHSSYMESIGLNNQFFTEQTYFDIPDEEQLKNSTEFSDFIYFQGLMIFNDHKYYYRRQYQKIPDVIALITGITNVLHFVFWITYSFYLKYNFGTYLFNNYLYLEDETENVKQDLRNFFKFNNKKEKCNLDVNKNDNEINKNENNIDKINPINNNQKFQYINENFVYELNDKNEIKTKNYKNNKEESQHIISDAIKDSENDKKDSDIKSNLKNKIHLFAFPNEYIKINYFIYFKNIICFSKKNKKNILTKYDITNLIIQKFDRRMDINRYLDYSNTLKLFYKILISNDNQHLLDLILKKHFKINREEKDISKKKIKINQNKINEGILNYLMNCKEKELHRVDEKIINCFLE